MIVMGKFNDCNWRRHFRRDNHRGQMNAEIASVMGGFAV
jgi:hypothetical protein